MKKCKVRKCTDKTSESEWVRSNFVVVVVVVVVLLIDLQLIQFFPKR